MGVLVPLVLVVTPGLGKSGGARVIYFNLTEEEVVLLVAVYAKAEQSTMSPSEIRKVV